MEKFMEDCLNAHNHYRAIHGSPPLQINPKLNDYANVWATYLAKKGDRSRRRTKPYGENVYIAYKDDVGRFGPVVEAVESWYQENKFYEYGEAQPANLKAARHFTQLIWKGSAFMGLGMVTSPIGQIYIVCSYDPPGNVENEFAENVLPPVDQEKEESVEEDPSKRQRMRIEYLEPKMEIVESMHRLYAVPSEKLRVWLVWLSQIGDEAEAWQRWLRAHIDLTLRMAARLKELEAAEEKEKPRRLKSATGEQVRRIFAYEEDAVTEDGIEYPRGVKDFYDIEQVLANIVSGEGKSMEESVGEEASLGANAEETKELPSDLAELASEGTLSRNANEEEEGTITEVEEGSEMEEEETRLTGGADETEGETNKETTDDIGAEEKETEETQETQETGETQETVETVETVEKEDKEEAEVVGGEEGAEGVEAEGIDDETDETSNYLKEWPLGTQWEPFGIQEEEDRSDIIEPLEMPTSVEEMRKLIKDFTNAATIYRSYFKHWKETSEQAIKEIAGRTVMPTAKQHGILNENDLEESLRACLGYPKNGFRKSDICFSPPGHIARMMALSERVGTVEFIKEMARADEDIPYFFYRTAEPDIEIAIKHDDEEVIPVDPEIEVISSNYGHLRFNLTDKPGIGGKCSIGNG